MAHGLKLAALLAVLLALPSGVRAEDLPEQRLACQHEARQNVRGPRQIDLDLYKRIVERRQLYVRDCMAMGSRDVDQTGSLSAPLPPKRPMG